MVKFRTIWRCPQQPSASSLWVRMCIVGDTVLYLKATAPQALTTFPAYNDVFCYVRGKISNAPTAQLIHTGRTCPRKSSDFLQTTPTKSSASTRTRLALWWQVDKEAVSQRYQNASRFLSSQFCVFRVSIVWWSSQCIRITPDHATYQLLLNGQVCSPWNGRSAIVENCVRHESYY